VITILDERTFKILKMLLDSNAPIKISEISKTLGVSNRTLRYDLDRIDDFLNDKKLPQLNRKPGLGIEYSPSPEKRQLVKDILRELNVNSYILSKQERVNIILSELLQQKNYITIDYIADKLMVSRSTVLKDLEEIREWLKKYNLNLKSTPRHGIMAEGEEKRLRRAAMRLLIEAMDIDSALDFVKSPVYMKNHSKVEGTIANLFSDMDIPFIEIAVQESERELNTVFSDEAYSNLVLHIAIAIKRIQQGRDIAMPREELNALKSTREYKVACSLVDKLSKGFKIIIPEEEIGYITVHFLGSSITKINRAEAENWLELHLITNEILKRAAEELGQEMGKDEQLFRGLLEHLRPAVYRLKNDLTLKNPLLKEIKRDYSELFTQVKGFMLPFEQYVGKSLNEEEIGYLTMHFGAALERVLNRNTHRMNILLVCGTGLGTAKLLDTRIRAHFNVNIVDTVSYRQIDEAAINKAVDLIVTTVPLNKQEIPWVKVNALLPEEDVKILSTYINTPKSFSKELDELISIIESYCEVKDYNQLNTRLSTFLNISNKEVERRTITPMLKEVLKAEYIELNVVANNWEEAVRAGGELLRKNDCIESRYIDETVKAVKEIGPYIVIAPGIAMPHARPELGVKKIGMSLISLKEPVCFGNKDNDPVRIVITVCAVDHSSHLKALSELVEFLRDEKFIDTVLNTMDKEHIVSYINSKSN